MWCGIVTLFPEMFSALNVGITGRALDQGLVEFSYWNPRDFASDRHKTVDDRPYGGGPGMLMAVSPLRETIHAAKAAAKTAALQVPAIAKPAHPEKQLQAGTRTEAAKINTSNTTNSTTSTMRSAVKTIYVSPAGKPFNQAAAKRLSEESGLLFVAGRYEGLDERLIELEIDEEWSLGDYVLTGGELPIMVMLDAIIRLLPGALGHEDSAEQDSFSPALAGLLDCPHYTRPEEVEDLKVPSVLLSGDHAAIARFRLQQSLGRTHLRRPDLFKGLSLSPDQEKLLQEFLKNQ